MPGWDELASGSSFYLTSDWLRFVDTDGVAHGRYLGRSVDGRPVAALSAHRTRAEIDGGYDDGYDAARTLDLPTGSVPAEGVLTLGGRRGFRSGVLASGADPPADLAELVGAAAGPSAWWWPYLPTSDAATVAAAAHRLTGRAGIHLVGAECVIDVVGTCVDDHVAALPTGRRRNGFRREERRFLGSGLTIRQVELAGHWARLGSLLAAVQQRYGHPQTAGQMSAVLRRQAEHLAAHSVVFACQDGDEIIGFALAFRWGNELTVRAVGFDYARLPDVGVYARLVVHAPLEHCYRHGLRRLHLGTGSLPAKCRRGARPRPLWTVTSLGGQDARRVARAADRFAATLPAAEAAAFTADVRGVAWR